MDKIIEIPQPEKTALTLTLNATASKGCQIVFSFDISLSTIRLKKIFSPFGAGHGQNRPAFCRRHLVY